MVEELLLSALFLAMGVEVLDSGRSCISDANGDRARVDSLGDRVGVASPPIIVVVVFNRVEKYASRAGDGEEEETTSSSIS